ncbi:hypothetical protein BV95_03759 [Sphingobium chlorophenolicum]|uniref:Uncharacterized protein n=1 Tax=Sphingobium chlorophenolicum TaxID=46429 RepID=A0A081R9Y5_SPHCR|nr:hypothetical protein BV95_03759 [Sphingobium chlorophenolicum]
MIGEVGLAALHQYDVARNAGGAGLPRLVAYLDRDAGQRLADAAGIFQPLLRGAEGQRTHLRRSVIFGYDRAPPVDHRLLDVGRAGRAGMQHPAQGGEIVAAAHFVGQGEQAHEHGRHRIEMRDAMLLDKLEGAFSVEPGLQHQQPVAARGEGGEEDGRCVVEGRCDQRAHARHRGVEPVPDPGDGLGLFRRGGGAADALGPTRRAGGVDHARDHRMRVAGHRFACRD